MKILLSIVFVLLIAAGCSKQEANDTAVAEIASETAGINWFKGSVDEAFQVAKEQNKPLFLYWGAIWCPPCNQLKATLFKRRDFIEQTRLFVPVYLDGDTNRAQYYGDRFSVMGYPTLIIFDPKGNEITRIPGGIELERYENVMQLALRQIKPVKSLVAEVTGGGSLSGDDCRLLAYYSWGQDNQQVLAEGEAAKTLYRAYNACPAPLEEERSRLFIDYLRAWLSENSGEGETERPLVADEQFREYALNELNNILSDRELTLANMYALRYEDGDTVRALTPPDSKERAVLISNWRQALEVISSTESLSRMERLGPLYAEVSFNKLENNGEISAELKNAIRQRVAEARATIENEYEHSALINMVRNILYHAQMYDYASEVISEEVDNAASPYYFMLELADLARKEGRIKDALNWLEKAYRESEPGATRFQWGVNYLTGLLEMTPHDEERIESVAVELTQNLSQNNDAFYNRNAKRLEKMSEKLQVWNGDGKHNAVILAIRNNMQALCAELEPGTEEHSRCNSFLAGFSG